jgi:hypothetical protein
MGLAERRAIKAVEDKFFPAFKKDLDAAAGFDVPVEVKWETLALEDQTHLYEQCIPKVYFEPLVAAVKAICVDDMGKEALKGGLKKVILCNTKDASSYRGFSFEDGVLTIDHRPTSNVDDIDERTKGIQEMVEKKL